MEKFSNSHLSDNKKSNDKKRICLSLEKKGLNETEEKISFNSLRKNMLISKGNKAQNDQTKIVLFKPNQQLIQFPIINNIHKFKDKTANISDIMNNSIGTQIMQNNKHKKLTQKKLNKTNFLPSMDNKSSTSLLLVGEYINKNNGQNEFRKSITNRNCQPLNNYEGKFILNNYSLVHKNISNNIYSKNNNLSPIQKVSLNQKKPSSNKNILLNEDELEKNIKLKIKTVKKNYTRLNKDTNFINYTNQNIHGNFEIKKGGICITKIVRNENSKEKNKHNIRNQPNTTSIKQENKNNKNLSEIPTNNYKRKIDLSESHYEYSQPGKDDIGKQKINQDVFLYLENPLSHENLSHFRILGIMDGHGENGHHISSYVSLKVKQFFSNINNFFPPEEYDYKVSASNININIDILNKKSLTNITETDLYEKIFHQRFKIIHTFITELNEHLKTYEYDTDLSGTTCVLVLLLNNKITCINIGDSRAILINSYRNLMFSVKNLSNDHKPTVIKEKERIILQGGIISPSEDEKNIEGSVLRVWVKGEKYPGLAVSRSIGDQIAKTVGVCCTPEITVINANEMNSYIIVASDGIWEFITSERAMKITIKFFKDNDPKGAAMALIKEANVMWRKMGLTRDDISCVVYFFRRSKV